MLYTSLSYIILIKVDEAGVRREGAFTQPHTPQCHLQDPQQRCHHHQPLVESK